MAEWGREAILTKSRLGIRPQINNADVSHINTISGTIIMNNDRLSFTIYDLSHIQMNV